ncbi:MAG: phosphoribosylaminoimidazolesuccinocarboxamide synthase [bacterium]
MENSALHTSHLNHLPLIHKGKVRDIYAAGEQYLLIVTTDRMSAFDVVLPTPIPDKGKILTEVSQFWFKRFEDVIPNQLSTIPLEDIVTDQEELEPLLGRSLLARRFTPLPIEAIVRGYLIGSGWKDYQKNGAVCGIELPQDMQLAEKLPEPIFTPSTKAAVGDHDENISFEKMIELLGEERAREVRDISIKLFEAAAEFALERGIIIADTKFEFGLDDQGQLHLIDEVLTPDSSRFWDASQYRMGTSPESFDKQFVRDYLETLDWDKTPPGPELPDEIAEKTAAKYREARDRLLAT